MSILDPALRNALRTLKLTGMLETLDARLAQTRDGTLGHLDFLQVLCEDEIARRESAALTRRIRRARFEEQSTFESFDFTANTKLPAAMLRDLSALRLARRRRISHPLRTRRRRQNPYGTSTWSRRGPPRRRRPIRQDLPRALRSGRRTR